MVNHCKGNQKYRYTKTGCFLIEYKMSIKQKQHIHFCLYVNIFLYFCRYYKDIKKYYDMAELKDLTKRSESYSQWYNDLVIKADLAE